MNTAPIVTIATDELIDEAKLTTKLGVTRATLQSWRYAAMAPRYIRVGKLVRYRVADVDAYIRAQTRGPIVTARGHDLGWSRSEPRARLAA